MEVDVRESRTWDMRFGNMQHALRLVIFQGKWLNLFDVGAFACLGVNSLEK